MDKKQKERVRKILQAEAPPEVVLYALDISLRTNAYDWGYTVQRRARELLREVK